DDGLVSQPTWSAAVPAGAESLVRRRLPSTGETVSSRDELRAAPVSGGESFEPVPRRGDRTGERQRVRFRSSGITARRPSSLRSSEPVRRFGTNARSSSNRNARERPPDQSA